MGVVRTASGAQEKGAAINAAPFDRLDQQALDEEATDRAVAGMLKFFEQAIEANNDRMIRSLSKDEITWMALAAISGYIVCRSEQARRLDCDFEDIFGLARDKIIDDEPIER